MTARRFAGGLPCLLVAAVAAASSHAATTASKGATSASKGSSSAAAPLVVVGAGTRTRMRITPENTHDLFLITTNGHVARRLTHTPQDEEEPAWSPDGLRVAFMRVEQSCKAGVCKGPTATDIWVMDAAGRAARRITHGTYDSSPSWSPDGQQLLFRRYGRRYGPPQEGIYVVGADGHGERLLVDATFPQNPDWSPDGKQIAYVTCVAADPTCETGVTVVDLDSGRRRTLRARGLPRDAFDVAWSPDGHRLAVSTSLGVFVVPSDGGTARRIATAAYFSATWAPAGHRLALTGNPRHHADIYVVGSGGQGLKRITNGPRRYYAPDWRPAR